MERELALTEHQNQKFEDDQETRHRMVAAKTENIRAEQARITHEQSNCKHKTGGMDKAGFYNGDGERYGSCTALLKLPTGEVYALCFRCQKEWREPSKRDVIAGHLSLAQYYKRLNEYNDVLSWPRKSFAPWQGEVCAASQFHIPKMIAQRAEDSRDFGIYVSKLPAQTIALAKVGVEPDAVAI